MVQDDPGGLGKLTQDNWSQVRMALPVSSVASFFNLSEGTQSL
jgi:hypothetical protein